MFEITWNYIKPHEHTNKSDFKNSMLSVVDHLKMKWNKFLPGNQNGAAAPKKADLEWLWSIIQTHSNAIMICCGGEPLNPPTLRVKVKWFPLPRNCHEARGMVQSPTIQQESVVPKPWRLQLHRRPWRNPSHPPALQGFACNWQFLMKREALIRPPKLCTRLKFGVFFLVSIAVRSACPSPASERETGANVVLLADLIWWYHYFPWGGRWSKVSVSLVFSFFEGFFRVSFRVYSGLCFRIHLHRVVWGRIWGSFRLVWVYAELLQHLSRVSLSKV